MKLKTTNRGSENGNVLFLILIAVALFAALSYAVTQSTRSGTGTADKEQALLSSASMTQYPTAMRTSIIRMVLGGTDVSNIYFNAPANFSDLSDVGTGVFHPLGGGAVFQQAPADVMAGASQGTWFFNANWDVPEIGIDGPNGNDVIAFLPNVSSVVCLSVNEELAINTAGCLMSDGLIPDLDAVNTTEANIRYSHTFGLGDSTTFPSGDQENISSTGTGCNAFNGQPSACFYDSDSDEYVFYSVLLER